MTQGQVCVSATRCLTLHPSHKTESHTLTAVSGGRWDVKTVANLGLVMRIQDAGVNQKIFKLWLMRMLTRFPLGPTNMPHHPPVMLSILVMWGASPDCFLTTSRCSTPCSMKLPRAT